MVEMTNPAFIPWALGSEKEMRQQLSTGGIAIKAYSPRYDAWVAIFNLPSNELFGGSEAAIERARLIVASVNALSGSAK